MRREGKALDNPRGEQNTGADHGEGDAEGGKARGPRGLMEEARGEAADQGDGVEEETEDEDGLAHEPNAVESFLSGHGRNCTTRCREESAHVGRVKGSSVTFARRVGECPRR